MPSHRRVRHSGSAARLPASRLPLGTQLPGSQTGRPTSQATNYSDSSRRGASSDLDTSLDADALLKTTSKEHLTQNQSESTTMPPLDDRPHLTTAEDKLRRQQERILLAEASLGVSSSQTDRSRPQSRGTKGKPNWEKMDMSGWDMRERPEQGREDCPVSEVRVNQYSAFMPPPPPMSRDTSLSRSMSSLSAQTCADADRHDSFFDSFGFPFQRVNRRGRAAEELKPYEDKPEEKQKTVEASFDKRAIYEVFGADLPGLEYMNSKVGASTGQLQFAQHPNGDVSAHMWSNERFSWENIGHFSNIRKRVEGQLARDRLRGETATQTLQKNSLAYFRTIAKQREYTLRGMEFGQAEIKQLLPSPEGPKVPSLGLPSESFSSVFEGNGEDASSFDQPHPLLDSQQQSRGVPAEHISQPTPNGPRSTVLERFTFLQEPKPGSRGDDPFTSAAPYSGIYGNPTSTSAPVSNMGPLKSILSRVDGTALRQGNERVPPPGMTAPIFLSDMPPPPVASDTSRRTSDRKPSAPAVPNLFPLFLPKQAFVATDDANDRRQSSLSTTDTPLRHRATTPSETRDAFKDKIAKLTAGAERRSLSQARTVLHDPFQSRQSETEQQGQSRNEGSYSQYDASDDHHSSFSQTKPPGIFTGPGAWPIEQTYRLPLRREVSLADSVPDTETTFTAAPTVMVNSVLSHMSARVTNDPDDPRHVPTGANWREPDEELEEWWRGGNKFARQEDFYQSIKTLAMSSTADTSTPSTRPRPIGTPSLNGTPSARNRPSTSPAKKHTDAPFNETTTRILIPVYENLASYVQGPIEQRRDYWSRWVQAPEWCIDRSPGGNSSFFDNGGKQPPARIGRDPRYRPLPGELKFSGFSPGGVGGAVGGPSVRGGIPALPMPYGGRLGGLGF